MLTSAFTGFVTGLSLIVAIGAQNAYVLRQGLARDHVAVVVAICALSDALLIAAGVGGVGALVAAHPTVLTLLKFLGAAYLLWYGVRSLLAARHATGLGPVILSGARSVVTTTLALTFLNPHVYLDTVLMLGNIANQQGSQGRWWFASGAALASVVWFCSIGYGAAASARWLVRPRTWQVLDVLIGITMIVIAVVLVTS